MARGGASYGAYVAGYNPPAWLNETTTASGDAWRSSWGTVRRVSAIVLDALRYPGGPTG
jgi:hypothetical protein